MSLRKGNRKKAGPKHQNTFAFRHNKHSSKSAKLMERAEELTSGLCFRCKDIVDWKLKYRKYKALTRPTKCNRCAKPNVRAAYHTICQACATDAGVCAKCTKEQEIVMPAATEFDKELQAKLEQLQAGSVPGMKERERRSLLRELERSGGVLEVSEDEDEDEDEEGVDEKEEEGSDDDEEDEEEKSDPEGVDDAESKGEGAEGVGAPAV